MQPKPLDIELLGKALRSESVRYVLVVGMAARLYGGTNVTEDTDLAISGQPDTVASLIRALAPLNPRPLRLPERATYVWDARSLHGPFTCLMTDAGKVDMLFRILGVDSFEGVYSRSIVRRVFGVDLRIAALTDLIAMKEASNRPKDRLHLMELYEIQRIVEEEGIGSRQITD